MVVIQGHHKGDPGSSRGGSPDYHGGTQGPSRGASRALMRACTLRVWWTPARQASVRGQVQGPIQLSAVPAGVCASRAWSPPSGWPSWGIEPLFSPSRPLLRAQASVVSEKEHRLVSPRVVLRHLASVVCATMAASLWRCELRRNTASAAQRGPGLHSHLQGGLNYPLVSDQPPRRPRYPVLSLTRV